MIYSYQPEYTKVLRYPSAIDSLRPPMLGVDFEWHIKTEKPTILGVSDGSTTVSVPFDSGWIPFISLLDRYPNAWVFVGHNFIRAERVVLSRLGRDIPLDRISDPIIWHYLTAAHLCKAGGKAVGEGQAGELERRGPGFMNIWTMCSMHTNCPCWKFCRGADECHDVPCPTHDPFWYNGLDALNPVLALPGLMRRAQLIGVDHLYPLHARLSEQFEIMKQRGTWVDLEYVRRLREDFLKSKATLWQDGQKAPTANSLPFNPESWQQVKRYFKENFQLSIENTQEDTIRKLVHENPEIELLADLLAYKEMGSGPDRWYAERRWDETAGDWEGYVVDQGGGLGTIHPNINFFTSSSRTACSNPNLQNIEKRRIDRRTGEKIGERMREAIVAPPGYNLYSADFSNAENRAFLHLAGYRELPPDLHTWMVENMGIQATDEIAIKNGGPREASKTITHAQDYLEGLQLKTPEALRSPRVRSEVAAGARLVFPDWTFQGKVVTFTGANLAKRSFGDASWANRRKALEAGERYIGARGAFPAVRDLQRGITRQVEQDGAVQVPEGYYLLSYDRTAEDRLKTAAAMWGQSPVAHKLKVSLLNIEAHPRLVPLIPVHDEHLVLASTEYEPRDVAKWIREAMEFETPETGLIVPAKVKWGKNWRSMQKVE